MTIETKYNVGDEVWLMYENKAITAQVIEINVAIITWDNVMSQEVLSESLKPSITRKAIWSNPIVLKQTHFTTS